MRLKQGVQQSGEEEIQGNEKGVCEGKGGVMRRNQVKDEKEIRHTTRFLPL